MTHNTEISTLVSRKTLALVAVLGAASFAFAQQKNTIFGRVVDAQNQAVPYASISFFNKANKLYSDATLTDEKGNYSLSLVPGDYEITIEAIDFKKKVFSQKVGQGALAAFQIQREASLTNTQTKELQSVVITATTKPYKVELDKKTYDVSTDMVSKGGSLQDVLQNVPSVDVDTDGTVSMRGSSNVRFLINGKPSVMLGIDDGANALQSIPADQIERIEVITNPSSKFEASGTSGILNIILKKNKKTGFNGSVIGTLGYLPQTGLNANLSWRKGNLTWFVNGGGSYRESKGTTRNNNYYTDLQQSNQLLASLQNGERKNAMDSYNATAGLVYDWGKNTSINLSGTVRTFEGTEDAYTYFDYRYNSTALPTPYMLRQSDGTNKNLSWQGDLGLDHQFSEADNLALSVSYQTSKNSANSHINQETNNIFDRKFRADALTPNMSYLISQNSQDAKRNTVIAKADYEVNLGENSKLEAGYRLDINRNQYDNTADEQIGKTGTMNPLGKFTNNTSYDEVFNAFYVQFKSKIGKLGYQIGLRDELSEVKIDYQNLEQGKIIDQKTKNYNNLFPSIYLSYELEKNNQLLLNYSRRIDRPRAFFMVPYFSLTDDQNLFLGNLDLNPSYVNSFELGYSIQKRKFTLNPTLYLRHKTDDDKMLVYRADERTNVFFTNPINLGEDTKYGLDLNATADLFSWWKMMASVDVFGYHTTGYTTYQVLDKNGDPATREADFEGKGFSYRMRLNSTFKVDKTLSFQFQGFYRGGQKTAFQDRKAMYAVNFGTSKTIWNGDGTITFNVQDIFNTRNRTVYTFSETSTRESYMQWQPRQVSLSLTYRFKQGEKIEQPKRKKDNNSNYNGDDEGAVAM
ncbi:TonB-dependent receptor domain-containing protein [Riemerella columbina]|uniref:TonB-dependent receptor domain-containing protein n=1 Tax=Riemerella columbina TaxID=103810 RepID=UPI0026708F44|nr:TonB-dependent receptor [Riemerella columbina]WKS94815.1 TonB-dependent receptor [Riemerella columbina]